MKLAECVAQHEAEERAAILQERPTKAVCSRCKLNIGWWAKGDSGYWKHQASGTTRQSCGMPANPIIIYSLTEEEWEQAKAEAKAAQEAAEETRG